MAGIRVSFNDLTGKTIGHLTVLSISKILPRKQTGREKLGRIYVWHCRCACGKEIEARHASLTRGKRVSCGCQDVHHNLTHGATRGGTPIPEYNIWSAMKERCESPKSSSYKNYGAIGRTFCERWRDFSNFIADMGTRPTPLHTLERIDNDRGYSPENCKWATRKEQMRNVSYNRLLTFHGRTMCVTAWAEELGLNPQQIFKRINRGWTTDRTLTTPWPSR